MQDRRVGGRNSSRSLVEGLRARNNVCQTMVDCWRGEEQQLGVSVWVEDASKWDHMAVDMDALLAVGLLDAARAWCIRFSSSTLGQLQRWRRRRRTGRRTTTMMTSCYKELDAAASKKPARAQPTR